MISLGEDDEFFCNSDDCSHFFITSKISWLFLNEELELNNMDATDLDKKQIIDLQKSMKEKVAYENGEGNHINSLCLDSQSKSCNEDPVVGSQERLSVKEEQLVLPQNADEKINEKKISDMCINVNGEPCEIDEDRSNLSQVGSNKDDFAYQYYTDDFDSNNDDYGYEYYSDEFDWKDDGYEYHYS